MITGISDASTRSLNSKRIKKLTISPSLLLLMLTDKTCFEVIKGVPRDTRFYGFAHNTHNNCIEIFFEHDSFESVFEGQEIPYFEVECRDVRK